MNDRPPLNLVGLGTSPSPEPELEPSAYDFEDHQRVMRGLTIGIHAQTLHVANCVRRSDGKVVPVVIVMSLGGDGQVVVTPVAIALTRAEALEIAAPTLDLNPPLEPGSADSGPPDTGLILPLGLERR